MSTLPIAIHSKRMLLPDAVREGTLFIDEGMITGVVNGLAMVEGMEFIDVGDKLVMAGGIDPHVHINEPGRTEWEGFETATKAAVAGGLTMLVDMPLNSSPVTTSRAAFVDKQQAAAGKLHCDCGFWGGVVPGNRDAIEGLIGEGVLGFKAFLTHSGIDEFPNVTEAHLREVMPILASYGLPLLVHCELEGSAKPMKDYCELDGRAGPMTDRRSYGAYLGSRPRKWEDDAISLMIRLCAETRCPVHIVHLSSASALASIRRAREEGLPLTVETAPHYLFFSAEKIGEGETLFKCAPPIREASNNEQLWDALREGVIDFVATDHSPAPPDLKCMGTGDFMSAWGGVSSLQLSLPVLWTGMLQRGIELSAIGNWLSASPALLVGQAGCRGRLVKGYRADLTIWDPERSFVVAGEALAHRHKATPYLGELLSGVVEETWINGERVYSKGIFNMPKGAIIKK